MASKKYGITPVEWAKHLKPYGKRLFWKKHRQRDKTLERAPAKGDLGRSTKPANGVATVGG